MFSQLAEWTCRLVLGCSSSFLTKLRNVTSFVSLGFDSVSIDLDFLAWMDFRRRDLVFSLMNSSYSLFSSSSTFSF